MQAENPAGLAEKFLHETLSLSLRVDTPRWQDTTLPISTLLLCSCHMFPHSHPHPHPLPRAETFCVGTLGGECANGGPHPHTAVQRLFPFPDTLPPCWQDFGLVSLIPPGVMDALICATVNVMNR